MYFAYIILRKIKKKSLELPDRPLFIIVPISPARFP